MGNNNNVADKKSLSNYKYNKQIIKEGGGAVDSARSWTLIPTRISSRSLRRMQQ
jgi:hypothetical protein